MLVLGANLQWRLATAVLGVLGLPVVAALYNLKESPVWLQRKGRMEEAEEAAAFYKISLRTEPSFVFEKKPPCQDRKETTRNLKDQLKAVLDDPVLQDSVFRQTFGFLAILFLLFGWCGFPILSFYATEIFQMSGSPISAAHTAWLTR